MTDQVGEYSANNTPLLENAFNENGIKEEHQEDDFADDKVDISEIVIVKDNTESEDHLLPDKMKDDKYTSWDNIKTELSFPKVQHDDIKVEEGISAADIRIGFNNGLLYCEDCHVYYEEYCAKCGMLVHILNRTAQINDENRSQKELPHNDILEIRDYFGEFHIFALKVIPVGVKFGPFVGLNRTECPWKIRGGKFVVSKDKSDCLNWMQYVHPARNISEQNLQVFQYKQNLYYRSTHQIQEADELLVYFGEEYEDSLNRNVEMDFIPTAEHIFSDAFACTFCCLGFSSKLYLAKHKTICPRNTTGGFSIEELMWCPSCEIHLDQKEYTMHHMVYCEKTDRKCILPTSGDRVAQVHGRKTHPGQMYTCQLCKYRTKYKGDLKNHTNQHYELKMYKCGNCCRRFKTKEILKMHVENTHIHSGGKEDSKHSAAVYMNAHLKIKCLRAKDKKKQFNCSLCEFPTKDETNLEIHSKCKHFKYRCETCDYKSNRKDVLKEHIETKHLKAFKYKCDMCDYKSNRKDKLKAHIMAKHLKEFKYKCDTCDYKANSKFHLNRHIELKHLEEFKYKCDTCDYKAKQKSSLRIHIEVSHLKEFKYKCETCDYKSKRKEKLKAHTESKHLEEFKYKCDTCDYKTNQKFNLRIHIESRHSNEFKYKCETCDYKSNRKDVLKAHIETKHLKAFKYKCDTCEYKSNSKYTLKAHIKSKHSEEFKYKCDTRLQSKHKL